jgi:hypothetical protein
MNVTLELTKYCQICKAQVDVLHEHFKDCGQDTEIAQKNLRLLKHTDMTIHWKGLEEHFLMVPLVYRFNHFMR